MNKLLTFLLATLLLARTTHALNAALASQVAALPGTIPLVVQRLSYNSFIEGAHRAMITPTAG